MIYVTLDEETRIERGRVFYDDEIVDVQMRTHSENIVRTLTHVLIGTVFMLLCCVQFSQKIRRRYAKLHRYNGRILGVLAIVVTFTSIRMALFAGFAGWQEAIPAIFYALLFFVFMGAGIYYARIKDYVEHREYMIRMFAIPLAAGGTVRLLLLLSDWVLHLPAQESFPAIFWISFTGHCFIAEAYIKFSKRKKRRPAASQSRATATKSAEKSVGEGVYADTVA